MHSTIWTSYLTEQKHYFPPTPLPQLRKERAIPEGEEELQYRWIYNVLVDKERSLLTIKLNKSNSRREGPSSPGTASGVRTGTKNWKVSILIHRPLMSWNELKYCLIRTSYLGGLFDIFVLLHIWQNCVCFWWLFTNEDTYHKEFESH